MSELRLPLQIGAKELDALADALAPLVAARLDRAAPPSPWLTGAKAAAEHLGLPTPQRVYKRLSELPHYRDGGRLVFNRDELDGYLARKRVRH